MATRRQFVQSLPAFAVAAHMTLESSPAHAAPAAPPEGHFHPKGKAPSEFTKEVLRKAKASLPFGDTRDFEEQKKGLIAPMKDLQIKNDAGGVAWDMKQFQFLDQQEEFDSVHPVAAPHRQAQQQLRPLRGDSRNLPGPRLRPRPDHLRPGQDRLDRLRLPGHAPR